MVHSEAIDDYLKIIFMLTKEGGHATTGDIAKRLDIAPASVTGMIKKLSSLDPPLVHYMKNRGVRLADEGKARALEVIRHHRLLETFLHDILDIPWDKVHEEAEKLEHYISEELEEAIARHLGDPQVDPHGAPIPTKDLEMPELSRTSLQDLKPGESGIIVRIPGKDRELRDYLENLGFRPGAKVTFQRREPFEGPVYVEIAGNTVGISPQVAKSLLVLDSSENNNHQSS